MHPLHHTVSCCHLCFSSEQVHLLQLSHHCAFISRSLWVFPSSSLPGVSVPMLFWRYWWGNAYSPTAILSSAVWFPAWFPGHLYPCQCLRLRFWFARQSDKFYNLHIQVCCRWWMACSSLCPWQYSSNSYKYTLFIQENRPDAVQFHIHTQVVLLGPPDGFHSVNL